MTELAVATFETDLDGALGLGGRALKWTETHGRSLLASASFTTEALVLGRWQREQTLRGRSSARFDRRVVRRRTSGTEAQLDGAVLYHALTLPRVDALFSDAKARTLLNRNLRAVLRGYAAAGVPFRYFGTEVLAVLGQPVALVGYDQVASGAVLIELLIGLENPCVVRPALKREPPAALFPLLRQAPPAHEFLCKAVNGIVERLGATPLDVAAALPIAPAVPELVPSVVEASVAIPLGVVEAVLEPEVRITGDLLVSSAALQSFEGRAAEALECAEKLGEDLLTAFAGAPLDGARPSDLLEALLVAQREQAQCFTRLARDLSKHWSSLSSCRKLVARGFLLAILPRYRHNWLVGKPCRVLLGVILVVACGSSHRPSGGSNGGSSGGPERHGWRIWRKHQRIANSVPTWNRCLGEPGRGPVQHWQGSIRALRSVVPGCSGPRAAPGTITPCARTTATASRMAR